MLLFLSFIIAMTCFQVLAVMLALSECTRRYSYRRKTTQHETCRDWCLKRFLSCVNTCWVGATMSIKKFENCEAKLDSCQDTCNREFRRKNKPPGGKRPSDEER